MSDIIEQIKSPNICIVSTKDLIITISSTEDQDIINRCAYELVKRIYIPGKSEKSFEDMLVEFGFKYLEDEQVRRKTL